jgi:hypothetical protein
MITHAETGISIDGKYYAVVGGYQSAKRGNFFIEYKDLLAIDFVRRRSKRIFFAFIFIGALWRVAPPVFNTLIRLVGLFGGTEWYLAVLTIIVSLTSVCMLALLFSRRAYIEFTFIGGIVRIPCSSMRRTDALRLVAEIREKKNNTAR